VTEPVRHACLPVTNTEITLEHLHLCSPSSSIQRKSKIIDSGNTTIKNSHLAQEAKEKTGFIATYFKKIRYVLL